MSDMNKILDGNTAALYAEMDAQDAAEVAYEQKLAMYPLEDFEELAWLHFYDPGYDAVVNLVTDFPDAVAYALCRFAQLSRGYYASSQMQIDRDESTIAAWIENWIHDEMKRLQAEKIEDAR